MTTGDTVAFINGKQELVIWQNELVMFKLVDNLTTDSEEVLCKGLYFEEMFSTPTSFICCLLQPRVVSNYFLTIIL